MSEKQQQIATISFFRYKGFRNKIWGMSQMYKVRNPMRNTKGVLFFKPLGSGGGLGYSIKPNLNVYGLLVVWENPEAAEDFFSGPVFKAFESHSTEQYTIFMKPLSSRGSWSGFSGWAFHENNSEQPVISALTRATIKNRFLVSFWCMVPRTSREHSQSEGLLFSQGIGEIPLLEQATFTVWENKSSMEKFAYGTFHGEAVAHTRRKNGFREEMFTRLLPYKTRGSWKGKDVIGNYLTQ